MKETLPDHLSEADRRIMALPDLCKVYFSLNNALCAKGLSLEGEVKLKMERFNCLMEMKPEETAAMASYLEWKNDKGKRSK